MHRVQDHPSTLTDHDDAQARDERRRRYEAVIRMIERWQADPSDYEERIWPELVRNIEANRLSPRKRFRD